MTTLSFDFISKFAVTLNTSLEVKSVIKNALDLLKEELHAEAGSVFLGDNESAELTFWAVKGGGEACLEGQKIPRDRGIVGAVVRTKESVYVPDVQNDPRFFSVVDKKSGFVTREVLCVPLLVRGSELLGAVQLLNCTTGSFPPESLRLLEHCGAQIALAIENARLIERLREHAQKLEAIDKRKEQMISVIAHELRTPLNIIQISAEMLATAGDNASQREKMAATLTNGVRRLTKLAGQLKTLSSSAAQPLDLKRETVSMQRLLEDVHAKFAEAAKKRELHFGLDVIGDEPTVSGDYGLLHIVVSNLISNAIRFTQNGGSVMLRARTELGLVTVEVEDTGIGISEEQIPLIFEKFYEVQDAIHHSSGDFEFMSGGLGLGLATVRTLTAAHGAKVKVKSQPGRGSVFSFSLPLASSRSKG